MFEYVATVSGPYNKFIQEIPIEMRYWRKECPVFTPYVMLSYGMVVKDMIAYDPGVYTFKEYNKLFLDSGGYQVIHRSLKVDVEEVCKWYLKVCDSVEAKEVVGMTLDYPISKTFEDTPITKDEIERRARFTYENTLKLLKYRDKLKVYAVHHGTGSLETLELWWKVAVKPVMKDVDGVAVGLKPIKLLGSVEPLNLAYIHNEGIENVHVFLGSGKKFIYITTFFTDFFKNITFDSARFSLAIGKGRILTPELGEIRIGRKGLKRGASYIDVSCHCPACLKYVSGNLGAILRGDSVPRYVVLTLHNLFQILQYLDYVKLLKNAKYSVFLKRLSKITNVDFLIDFKELGFEKAYEKHYGKRGVLKWL